MMTGGSCGSGGCGSGCGGGGAPGIALVYIEAPAKPATVTAELAPGYKDVIQFKSAGKLVACYYLSDSSFHTVKLDRAANRWVWKDETPPAVLARTFAVIPTSGMAIRECACGDKCPCCGCDCVAAKKKAVAKGD
jgi:hypothetical protein